MAQSNLLIWRNSGLKKLAFFVWLLSTIPGMFLSARENALRFKRLTIDDGLSQSLVYTILQDDEGFMWFGTKDGLNRYDGNHFTIFRHDAYDSTSISGQEVRVLFIDRQRNLWIGTSGLNRFDPQTETFRHYLHDPARANSLSHNTVTAIIEDSTGALWIGTSQGLNRFTPDGPEGFTRFLHDPNDPRSLSHSKVNALVIDRQGTLWVGSAEGLNARPRGTTSGFIRYQLPGTGITSLFQDHHGTPWVGTPTGIIRIDFQPDGTPVFKFFPLISELIQQPWQGSIMAISERPDGKFWVGTLVGLTLFDPANGAFQFIRYNPIDPQSISYDGVISIFQDRSGIFWFGTPGKGINKLVPVTKPFHCYGGILSQLTERSGFSVSAIFEDRSGIIWVAANNRLYQLDRETDQWRRFNAVTQPVGQVIEDSLGCLWFSTGGGFFKYDPGARQISLHRSETPIRGYLRVVSENGVWNRLNQIPGLERHANALDQAGINVHRILTDSSKIAWLATDAGLMRFNGADSSLLTLRNAPRNPASLSHDVVYSLLPDPHSPAQLLWVGTAGGGLNCLDKTKLTFTHFTEKKGLPNNVIYGILPDRQGYLWLSTNRGLSQFNPQTKSFRNFDVQDGLQSNEFNRNAYFLSARGEMFFGGINGLNIFDPDSIRNNPHAPPVVITDFQLNYQSVSFRDPKTPLAQPIAITNEIRLAYYQNTIAFEFAALEFTEPVKNRYAYRLENFDPQWVQAGTNRKAIYTDVSPGEYIFRVKAANNDGVWNETGAAMRITITPPLWQTWWAYVGYVILAALLVLGIVQGRVRRLENRSRQLETAVQARTAEVVAHEKQLAIQAEKLLELDRIKSSFFANISHEFRTPLTLILGPIEILLAQISQTNLKHELHRIQKNAQRLLRLVNQLLDLSRLETGKMTVQVTQGNIVPVLGSITMSFASLAEQKGIELQFYFEQQAITLFFDRDKIEKIFFNLLSNAFKFTSAGGVIAVKVGNCDRVLAHQEPPSPENEHAVDLSQGGPTAQVNPAESAEIVSPDSISYLQITVTDTGIGMPSAQLANIFDRFYQIDNSSTRQHEGTGIGLALVKELVTVHHGRVEVTSVEGAGSTFNVYLPMNPEAFEVHEIAVPSSAPVSVVDKTIAPMVDSETSEPPDPDGKIMPESTAADLETIVLVVEDHADVRAYIREHLENSYRVIEARDGVDGLEKAREFIPDLIVSDVMMPRLDGNKMCCALKTDERTSHIPVILLTARAALDDKLVGLKTGADDYLTKPFNAAELLARVENLITLRRRLREQWQRTMILKPSEIAGTPLDQAFLEKVLAVAEAHLDEEDFSIEDFARQVGMSRSQLHRKLHALTNQSASLFLRSVRLQRAAELLRQNTGTVGEIAYQVGFSSQAYFTRCFQEQFGCAPKEYAAKKAGPKDN